LLLFLFAVGPTPHSSAKVMKLSVDMSVWDRLGSAGLDRGIEYLYEYESPAVCLPIWAQRK